MPLFVRNFKAIVRCKVTIDHIHGQIKEFSKANSHGWIDASFEKKR